MSPESWKLLGTEVGERVYREQSGHSMGSLEAESVEPEAGATEAVCGGSLGQELRPET